MNRRLDPDADARQGTRSNPVNRSLLRPILGTAVAVAVTAAMDAAGMTVFSALPLFPLMAIL
jgi:hypothetical protein